MSSEEANSLDINHAGLQELAAVSGIGPALAGRVIEGRPYQSLEDLLRVKGIGTRLLEQIRPYLSVSFAAPAASEEAEAAVEEQESLPQESLEEERAESLEEAAEQATGEAAAPLSFELAEEDAVAAQAEAAPPEPAASELPKPPEASPPPQKPPRAARPADGERAARRPNLVLYGTVAGLITLAMAVIFTLGLLGLLNGGLSYVSVERYTALQRQVDHVDALQETLRQDLDALRVRLDALEALSGRVGEVERQNQALRAELEQKTQQLELLQQQVNELNAQFETVQRRSQEFDRLLVGLRSLLDEIRPPSSP